MMKVFLVVLALASALFTGGTKTPERDKPCDTQTEHHCRWSQRCQTEREDGACRGSESHKTHCGTEKHGHRCGK